MLKLKVIVASTRPGRAGLPVAHWFAEQAKRYAQFEVDLVDLKEINLPPLDEPKHPRLGQYEHDHTKAWSARIKAADAFVFVTPEYNHSAPPALLNAFDYLYNEWNYKPAAFVSYGGISAGTRSVIMTKMILNALKVVPIVEAVNIPFVNKAIQDGVLQSSDSLETAAKQVLDELARWAPALAVLRS